MLLIIRSEGLQRLLQRTCGVSTVGLVAFRTYEIIITSSGLILVETITIATRQFSKNIYKNIKSGNKYYYSKNFLIRKVQELLLGIIPPNSSETRPILEA